MKTGTDDEVLGSVKFRLCEGYRNAEKSAVANSRVQLSPSSLLTFLSFPLHGHDMSFFSAFPFLDPDHSTVEVDHFPQIELMSISFQISAIFRQRNMISLTRRESVICEGCQLLSVHHRSKVKEGF